MNRLSLLATLSAFVFVGCGPSDNGPIDGDVPCGANLLAGDLVITEVMANPEGDDEGNEYFEIYNATSAAIDLTGLVLEKSAVDGTKVKTHAMKETIIEPGQYMALGGVLPEFRAPYIGYGYGADLGVMTNSGGQLRLVCEDVEVDQIFYGEAVSGHSEGLDGNLTPDFLANDSPENFCNATTEFATASFGSPGVKNEPCSIVVQTTCLDGGSEREVIQPAVGDLVITEFMADSSAVGDEVGEWFELVATGNFDLNGLVAGNVPTAPKLNVVDTDCVKVSTGDHLLFARSSDELVNGGLPTPNYTFSFGLANGGSSLFVGIGDTVIDTVTWTSSKPGKSTSLDPGSSTASANDDEANWCPAKSPYGAGDLGTPGAANLPCDTSGMCMDGGTLRPTVAPLADDVTITEFMANPAAVSDTNGEYFEVHFAAAADLNGLQLGKVADPALVVSDTLDSVECVSVDADTYVVFARKTDTAINGGLPTTNIFATTISLGQTAATTFTIFVAIGNQLLDVVQYQGSETASGISRQIDSAGTRCNSTTAFGAGDIGTPGLANPLCP